MNWYLAVLKNYAGFSGRARRTEYWMFVLFNAIFSSIAVFLDYIFDIDFGYGYGAISGLYSLVVFIPSLAVSVRRLHDIGKSGWMLLIGLIPLIGVIWLIILFVTEGNKGENQYGPDPKAMTAITE